MQPSTLEPVAGEDIVHAALKVLLTADPHVKAERTNRIVELWQAGLITPPAHGSSHLVPPDRPARDATKVKLVPAKEVPKRGKGGSLASRQALLHSLVHIENAAIDLAWDIVSRFGCDPSYQLPREFFDDFVTVAADECRHFLLLERRLAATGSHYGALPAHDGLWESAAETGGSLGARLAVEHCTHEARGLDVLPQTIHRFRSNGDAESADLLQDVIYAEEISHCAAGVRWLKHLHRVALDTDWEQQQQQQQQQQSGEQQQPGEQQLAGRQAGVAAEMAEQQQQQQQQQRQQQPEQRPQQQGAAAGCATQQAQQAAAVAAAQGRPPSMPEWAAEARRHPSVESWFHALIRRHFRGPLKPPFNEAARAQAGFGPEWYLPLAADGAPPRGVQGGGAPDSAEEGGAAARSG